MDKDHVMDKQIFTNELIEKIKKEITKYKNKHEQKTTEENV